jgi:hypothetical protein
VSAREAALADPLLATDALLALFRGGDEESARVGAAILADAALALRRT